MLPPWFRGGMRCFRRDGIGGRGAPGRRVHETTALRDTARMKRRLATLIGLLLAGAVHAADAPPPAARTMMLVRHGHYVADPVADARRGPGLSPIGVAQARLAGARLAGMPTRFDALLVSPLQRYGTALLHVLESQPRSRVLSEENGSPLLARAHPAHGAFPSSHRKCLRNWRARKDSNLQPPDS